MQTRIEVGVLGATGMVGQHFVKFLQGHPWFELTWLGASDRSAGKKYRDAMTWHLGGGLRITSPTDASKNRKPGNAPRLVFSAMDASVATEIERAFAQAGHVVVSNSRNHRMERDVPLLVPEVNADHLKLVPGQQRARGWKGQIVTNPNCSTIVLTLALAPLKQFGITKVIVTTLQAISGAGYPGVASMDIIANVIPFIGSEEEKMQQETQKILGDFARRTSSRSPPKSARTAIASRWSTATLWRLGRILGQAPPSPTSARPSRHSAACRSSASCPARRQQPVIYMEQADRPAAAQRCRARERHGGVRRPSARMPGVRLQVRRARPQHRSRRRRRRRPECRADALGRDARLMIVMKFGGTSVESAAAIERVAGIVTRPRSARPVVVVSAMGKTTNKLLAIATAADRGQTRRLHPAQLHDLRDFHSREARLVCRSPNAPSSTAPSTTISRS